MDKYVAYVGSYTHEEKKGLHIFDIDSKSWQMTERKAIEVNNPVDMTISPDGQFLYSIVDEGVRSFRILEDGDLEPINAEWTGAIRGNDLEEDALGEFLFVGGYYDGSVVSMRVNEDGSVGEVCDNIFHKSIGKGITEFNAAPHVTAVKMLPDQSCVCAVDSGLDQIIVYDIDRTTGKLTISDIVRTQLDSSPGALEFGADGRFAYVLSQNLNLVCVYELTRGENGKTEFHKIQENDTQENPEPMYTEAYAMQISPDGRHLYVTNAGINSMSVFSIDQETGLLTRICENRTSGVYPKNLLVMPDNHHVAVLTHDSNAIMQLDMNYEKGYFLMDAKPLPVIEPNCICIHRLS